MDIQDPNLPARDLSLDEGPPTFETPWGRFDAAEYYPTLGDALDAINIANDALFAMRVTQMNPAQPHTYSLLRHAELPQGATIGAGILLYGQCEPHGICIQHNGTDVHRLTSIARLTHLVAPYRDKLFIDEIIGRCCIIEGNGAQVMHGTLNRTNDPITLERAKHECYGVQITVPSLNFIEIKRLMLCPCASSEPKLS